VPIKRNDDEERAARIDMILEELRLNTEDMRELAKQTVERARKANADARLTVNEARAIRARKKR
jgi:hypothetical protein